MFSTFLRGLRDLGISTVAAASLLGCGGGSGGAGTSSIVLSGSASVFPSSGPVGTLVTLSGGPFAASVFQNQVKFGEVLASISLASSSSLVVSVPYGATSGAIVIQSSGAVFQTLNAFKVLPSISGVAPASAAVGANVILQGSALENPQLVTIGGISLPVLDSTYGSITVTIPPGIGSGPIQVQTQDGVAVSPFPFKIAPAILAFFPASAKQGDPVTLVGSSLQGAQKVSFAGVDALSFQNPDPGTIVATVPPGAGSGPIVVTTTDGIASSPGSLSVLPTVGAIAPGNGGVGANVTIQGSAFFGVSEVLFGAAPAAFSVTDSFTLAAIVPLAATSGPVVVKTSAGNASSAGNFTVMPSVLGFNPASAVEGSLVTIQGTSFQGVVAVDFGGIGAGTFGNPDSQTLTAAVPPDAKTGPISVTTADGIAVSVGNFVVTPFAADFQPKTGPVGAEVTISGTTFVNVTNVSFDGLDAASFTNPNGNTIVAVVPDAAASGPILVTTQDGATQSAANFSTVYPRFLWSANETDGTVSEFTQNDKNGELRHTGFRVSAAQSNHLTLHPSSGFAYVTNGSANTVSVYQVDLASGALTAIQSIPAGTKPVSSLLTPSGSFAYVANESSGNISIFQVGGDGKLTALATTNAGLKPRRLGMDPEGKFLYVPLEGSNEVAAFAIEANGLLTAIGNTGAGVAPQHVVVDPAGKFAYVAADGSSRITSFSVEANGALNASSTTAVGSKPRSLALDYSGKFLFVVSSGSAEIAVYRVQSNGSLVFSDKKNAGTAPESVVPDASGRFLSVAAKGSNEIHRFQLDRTSGLLSTLGKVRTRSGPTWLASARGATPVVFKPQNAVWANEASGTVSSATLAEASGVLTSADSEVGGTGLSAIASDLSGKTVIVSSVGTTSLAAYKAEAGGNLTLLDATAGNPKAMDLEIEPSGRFLYVANGEVQNNVRVFRIYGANGVDLSGIQTFNLPPPFQAGNVMDPRALAMDPAGRFLFALTSNPSNGGMLLTFSLSPTNGQLTLVTPLMLFPDKEGTALAVDPQGSFVYAVANVAPDYSVRGYRVDPLTGTLTLVDTKNTDTKPLSIAFEPTGRFFYVACIYGNGGSGSVLTFSKNATSGAVTKIQTLASGTFPEKVAVDPSGKFLLVNHSGSDDFRVFAIEPVSGLLSEVFGSPFANPGGANPGPVFVTGKVE